jgi:hypothetical protein
VWPEGESQILQAGIGKEEGNNKIHIFNHTSYHIQSQVRFVLISLPPAFCFPEVCYLYSSKASPLKSVFLKTCSIDWERIGMSSDKCQKEQLCVCVCFALPPLILLFLPPLSHTPLL